MILMILMIIMFFLATFVDMNMFKFIEGFCTSVKLLNDLLCAEIAEFFLEIVKLLTTLLFTFSCFSYKCGGFLYHALSHNT